MPPTSHRGFLFADVPLKGYEALIPKISSPPQVSNRSSPVNSTKIFSISPGQSSAGKEVGQNFLNSLEENVNMRHEDSSQ